MSARKKRVERWRNVSFVLIDLVMVLAAIAAVKLVGSVGAHDAISILISAVAIAILLIIYGRLD